MTGTLPQTQICAYCRQRVPTRKDGTLVPHKVGKVSHLRTKPAATSDGFCKQGAK